MSEKKCEMCRNLITGNATRCISCHKVTCFECFELIWKHVTETSGIPFIYGMNCPYCKEHGIPDWELVKYYFFGIGRE